jgi:hypothetical protein
MMGISYGGGVQSTALLVLAAQRKIPYRSFIFANTGDELAGQAKVLARKLLDAPEVITYIHPPFGSLAVIGGRNRAMFLPNFFAGLAIEELGGGFHDTSGAIVFTGYLPSGHLTGLPAEAAALIRDICPSTS